MSLVRLRNGPLSENVAFWSNVTGKMFVCPPGLPRNGLSSPPGGALSRTSDPHGGATDVLRWNCPFTNSYDFPYERADRRLAVAQRIPGQSNARPEVVPVGQHAGLAGEARVAGEIEARRRIREHRALRTRLEARHVELIDRAVHELLREERLPPNAVVQRQARPDPPGVLRVQPDVFLLHVERVRRRLDQRVRSHPAQQEVRQSESGLRAVDGELARRTDVPVRLRAPAREAAAERVLMAAAHERQVVADLPGRRDDVASVSPCRCRA